MLGKWFQASANSWPEGQSHDFQWDGTQGTCFLSYSCSPLTVSWWHTLRLCILCIVTVEAAQRHYSCAPRTLALIHPTTQGKVSLSWWNTASGGPSTDRPLKGQGPVNVNNCLSRVRLNRLPTSRLHLPPSLYPHLLHQLPPTKTHPCTALYFSLCPLSVVGLSSHLSSGTSLGCVKSWLSES